VTGERVVTADASHRDRRAPRPSVRVLARRTMAAAGPVISREMGQHLPNGLLGTAGLVLLDTSFRYFPRRFAAVDTEYGFHIHGDTSDVQRRLYVFGF